MTWSPTTSRSSTCRPAPPATYCTRHPEQADRALTHIREACDTVLTNCPRSWACCARPTTTCATEPVRGLARLTDMIDTLAAAGPHGRTPPGRPGAGAARRRRPGRVPHPAGGADQRAQVRHRHGPPHHHLHHRAITLDVVNTVAADRIPTSSGYGILGMRERAATAGGTLDAQARPGRPFRRARRAARPSTEGDDDDHPGAARRRPDPDPRRLQDDPRRRTGPGGRRRGRRTAARRCSWPAPPAPTSC